MTREDGVYKCKVCKFMSKTKFSLKRHIQTIHGGMQELEIVIEETHKTAEADEPEMVEDTRADASEGGSLQKDLGIESLLVDGGLPHILPLMKEQNIDIEILFEMKKHEFLEIGILTFGDWHKLEKLLKSRPQI